MEQSRPTYSIIIPVYLNEQFIPELMTVLSEIFDTLDQSMEAVIVVDGSPDNSLALLQEQLPKQRFPSNLLVLSRNFGSFAAIRSGLEASTGQFFGFLAADLQEPTDLLPRMFSMLAADECDLVIGVRESRNDPWTSRVGSKIFWTLYRKFVQPEIPSGGVDIFACNRPLRDQLLQMQESNTSLVGQLFWLGFRRQHIDYVRQARKYGKSAWTFRKKTKYFMDSLFGFSDLPMRLFMGVGLVSMAVVALLSITVIIGKLAGWIPVPGYAATILALSFFAGLNSFGLGLLGAYVWRAFENTKHRPTAVVMKQDNYPHPKD